MNRRQIWRIRYNLRSLHFSPETIMNEFDLFHLKENYVNHIIDGMDVDSLAQLAHDFLMDDYEKLTEDQLKEEILNLYDQETLEDLMPVEEPSTIG